MLKELLAEPSTRGMDTDGPRVHQLRRRILQEKSFLRPTSDIVCCPGIHIVLDGEQLPMPGWAFGLWRQIENCFHPWMKTWAMFAQITLVRADIPTKEIMI